MAQYTSITSPTGNLAGMNLSNLSMAGDKQPTKSLYFLKHGCLPELRRSIFDELLLLPDKTAMLKAYQAETHEILVKLRWDGDDIDEGCEEFKKYNDTLSLRQKGRGAIQSMKIKTPSLLIALRGDPVLYAEALESYYRINTFHLNVGSPYLRALKGGLRAPNDGLSERTLNSVKKIVIDCDGNYSTFQQDPHLKVLPRLPNIESVYFKVSGGSPAVLRNPLFGMMQRCKAIKILIIEILDLCKHEDCDFFGSLVGELNAGFGLKAKLLDVIHVHPVYFWDGVNGKVLSWTQPSESDNEDSEEHLEPDHQCIFYRVINHKREWPFAYDENGKAWMEIEVDLATWRDV